MDNTDVQNRSSFLAGVRTKYIKKLDLKGMNGEPIDVYIMPLSGAQTLEMTELWAKCDAEGKTLTDTDVYARVIAYACCDKDGNRIFSGMDDLDAVLEIPVPVIRSIGKAVQEISKLTEDGVDSVKKD